MKKRFLDKVEDNAAVRIWPEKIQQKKGDSLTEGYVSELWDFTRTSVTQNNLQELKDIWDQWVDETKQLFYRDHGDLPYLLNVKVDKYLFRALAQYWNPTHNCFNFGKVATRIKLKGDRKCVPWKSLRDLILEHLDTKKRVDVFTLSIYGLVIFPKALWHIDEAVLDLFDRLDKRVTPVSTILVKTFRSLSASWRGGEGRFIGCTQLLLPLFHSHFWKVEKVSYRVCSENYSPLKEFVATPMRDNIFKEKWMYRLKQFISTTQGLAQCEFTYKGDNYKKKLRNTRPIEEHLQVIPSEQEIEKQDFEKRSSELGKKIEHLEEKNMQLGLDVDVQKLEAKKMKKRKEQG
ncbi:hypothetical protein Goshw_006744 [Gossypium schwendimanii]|uniref:DUF7745 domain-containing protein n=1 Tax=Gossypium schwendimanii TaxID=34291 RepID=A0A7J9NC42_GOSSC|nr:hypothetical protein [Gossypium schwendimanii]